MEKSIFFVDEGIEWEKTSSGKCLRVFWNSPLLTFAMYFVLFVFVVLVGFAIRVLLSKGGSNQGLIVLLPTAAFGFWYVLLRFSVNYTEIHVNDKDITFTHHPLPSLISENSETFPRHEVKLSLDSILRYSAEQAVTNFRICAMLPHGKIYYFLDRVPNDRVAAAFAEIQRWLSEEKDEILSAAIAPEDAIAARSRRRLKGAMIVLLIGLGIAFLGAFAALSS